ncbi:MAG: hypothetical protein AAGE01_08635 [Pseudomonadota bacterium]
MRSVATLRASQGAPGPVAAAPAGFGAIVEHAEQTFAARLDGHPVAIPAAHARATRTLPGGGELALRTAHWTASAHGDMRWVRLRSPKIDIVSVFFYPHAHRSLPLYAMEFVLLGKRPIVAVMDLVAPRADADARITAARILQTAHSRHPEQLNHPDAPSWFEDCRSGNDFFLRPAGEGLAAFAAADGIHAALWTDLLDAIAGGTPAAAGLAAERAAFVADYKAHHRANSPGLPLLHKSFGQDWTDDFLANGFFGP